MASDLSAILKDKRLLIGVAGAAGVGGVVFLMRRQSGTGPASTTVPASATGYVPMGTADTSGTDMASFLSSWGQSMLDAVKAGGQAATTATRDVVIPGGNNVDEWLRRENVTLSALLALNPNVQSMLKVAGPSGFQDPSKYGLTFDTGPVGPITVKVPV